jgi:hypothetical protein
MSAPSLARIEATSIRNSWMLEGGKFIVAALIGFFTAGWSARGTVSDVTTRVSVLESREDKTQVDIGEIKINVQHLVDVLIEGKK